MVSPSTDLRTFPEATLGISRLILGTPRRTALVNILRGNIIREVAKLLPEDIDLLVYA